jgi:hypothetical protein
MNGVVFGRNPHQRDEFDVEADAAEAVGLDSWQVDLAALLDGDLDRAVNALPERGRLTLLYRGWLLTAAEYEELFEAVGERGHRLVTTPGAYAAALYVPRWYPRLKAWTARTVWTDGFDAGEAWAEASEELGPPPWIIKDHVKSAKEHWSEACFVPAAASRERFVEQCERMVEVRGDRADGGIVVRRFLDLKSFGRTADGPAFLEFRLFFARGALVAAESYYDFDVEVPDFSAFEALAARIGSPFFSMDVARLSDGGWVVIETNDGGTSGLPESLDPRELLAAVAERL